MKRTMSLLLLCMISSISLGQTYYAGVELYKESLPTLAELDYLKVLMPKEKDMINEAAWAVRSGYEFEYEMDVYVWFEDPGNVVSVDLIKPDNSEIPLVFDDDEFALESGYFLFDDMKADFPAGIYAIRITYTDEDPDYQPLVMPDYLEADFPEIIDGELVLENNIWNLNWSTVAGIEDYWIEADDLLRDRVIWEDGVYFADPQENLITDFDSLLRKGRYNCGVTAEAIDFLDDSDGVPKAIISCLNLWSFKRDVPVFENKITKATVTSGINDLDTISLTGQLEAIEADFLNAATSSSL